MKALAAAMGDDIAAFLREAIRQEAAEIAGYDHRNGSEAMREFSLTRRDLRKIPKTDLPGRSKPVYLIKHIKAYKDQHTTLK